MGNLVIKSGASAEDILAAMRLALMEDEAILTGLIERVTQLQQGNGVVFYSEAGAIAPTGYALLQVGAAVPFTLPLPPTNGMRVSLTIKAMDACAYTVGTPSLGINGAYSTMTWSPLAGNQINLVGLSGVWYLDGTPIGVTLT